LKRTPLKRRTALKARKPLARKPTKPKARKPLRAKPRPPASLFSRWVHATQRCAACGRPGPVGDHIKTRGAGGKDANNVWPLCAVPCHTLRHTEGIRSFAERRGLDPLAIARQVWARWESHLEHSPDGSRAEG
jgi:hypothetical protein